ncbi:MAG: hypothetical protein ABIL68_14840 [bacterium]
MSGRFQSELIIRRAESGRKESSSFVRIVRLLFGISFAFFIDALSHTGTVEKSGQFFSVSEFEGSGSLPLRSCFNSAPYEENSKTTFLHCLAQEVSFYGIVPQYEQKMNDAARSWMNKNYSRALDGFFSAKALLTKHMPTPLDPYGWHWCQAMQTYTVVLERMVEVDMYRIEGKEDFVRKMAEQAMEWAETLKKQAGAWMKVQVQDPTESTLRKQWIQRFLKAVNQAKKVARDAGVVK